MKKAKKQSFIHGAFVLAFSGIVVKIIGALYKIPLGAVLGPVGMADFSVAYNIYALLFVLSTAGVPVAVSKLVSESLAKGATLEVGRIYRASYIAFVMLGATGFFLMFFGAEKISVIMGNVGAAKAIRAISPSVLFVSMSAINRGYFQGHSNMYPTAVSEVLEALGKLIFGLVAAIYLSNCGFSEDTVSAGAISGVTVGTLLSALYFTMKKEKGTGLPRQASQGYVAILKKLVSLSVPITLGAAVISLTNVIDSALVMNLLSKEAEMNDGAKWMFGAYNYAATLFNLPSALVTTLAVSLVPALSSSFAERNFQTLDKTVNAGGKLAMLVAFPAAFGMAALSRGIVNLLYGGGVEESCITLTGELLAVMSLAVAPLAIVTVTNSVHQALGRAEIPVKSMLAGSVVKIVSNLLLVSRAQINIYGAAISTVLCYLTIAVFNLSALRKYEFIKVKIGDVFLKPFMLGAVTFCAAFLSKKVTEVLFESKVSTVLSVIFGVFVCVLCAFVSGSLSLNELKVAFGRKKVSKFLNNG